MGKRDSVDMGDQATQTMTIDLSPPRFYRVKVLAENGIFKAGKQYNQGSEAVLELRAAQRLEAAGDVEIGEEVVND